MLTPRDYQSEAIEDVLFHWHEGTTRQLICLPTGTGKTVIFALLAKQLNMRTLVICPSNELIQQAMGKFKDVWPGVSIGIVKAEADEVDAQVVVASIQTASRPGRLERLRQQGFGLQIIDEAHRSAAPSYTTVISGLGFDRMDPKKLMLGTTATPKRGDGIGLGGIFEKITFERSMKTMIRAGYLAPLIGKQIQTRVELDDIKVRHGDFIAGQLAARINTRARNQLIVDNFQIYGEDRRCALAFCAGVQHALDLAALFCLNGISAAAVYGSMPDDERAKIIQGFKDGQYRVVTNCQLLTEGFDCPGIDCILLGRPTKSEALFTQMIGRGTRIMPPKQDCLILDYTDNTARLDLCTYRNTLEGTIQPLQEEDDLCEAYGSALEPIVLPSDPDAAVVGVKDIEFFDRTAFAWTNVEDTWHLKVTDDEVWVRQAEGGYEVIGRSAGQTSILSKQPLPMDYAFGVAEDWLRAHTTKSRWARKDAPWRAEPATDKQLDVLRRMGIAIDAPMSKGEACALIDRTKSAPPTQKQLDYLKKLGAAPELVMTKREAALMIAERVKSRPAYRR